MISSFRVFDYAVRHWKRPIGLTEGVMPGNLAPYRTDSGMPDNKPKITQGHSSPTEILQGY